MSHVLLEAVSKDPDELNSLRYVKAH